MRIKQYLLIAIAIVAVFIVGDYAYDYLRVKHGRDCFAEYAELERNADSKLLNMLDEHSKASMKLVYNDNSTSVHVFTGEALKKAYGDYLQSDAAKTAVHEYHDVVFTKEDGHYVVEGTDYAVRQDLSTPFRMVFDGERTDHCIVVESNTIIPVSDDNPYRVEPPKAADEEEMKRLAPYNEEGEIITPDDHPLTK